MPTADEYRQAARQLRSLGEDLGSDWTMLRTATDVDRIAGGAVGAVLDRSLETVRTELTRTRSELDRLAAICDRRAEICADHAADVQRHRALVASTDTWTSPPPAPAWWVAT